MLPAPANDADPAYSLVLRWQASQARAEKEVQRFMSLAEAYERGEASREAYKAADEHYGQSSTRRGA